MSFEDYLLKHDLDNTVNVTDADDKVLFEISNRTIVPKNYTDILVEHDAKSRHIKFRMQKMFEDTDMSTKNIDIHYVTMNNEHDKTSGTDITITGDYFEFTWLVSEKVCLSSGFISFSIECYDDQGFRWFTKPCSMNINGGIAVDGFIPEPDGDWYLSWRNEANGYLNSINAQVTQILSDEGITQVESDVVVSKVNTNLDTVFA